MKILKSWICGGRRAAPGEVLELPEDQARGGIGRGLCQAVSPAAESSKAGNKSRRFGKTAG